MGRAMGNELAEAWAVDVSCENCGRTRRFQRDALMHLRARGCRTMAQLENASIGGIFQSGLHEFITTFVDDNSRLGAAIGEQYLV